MQQAREFARAAGDDVPTEPKQMGLTEIHFLSKMIIDEMLELLATVTDSKHAKAVLVAIIKNAKSLAQEPDIKIEDQADALVDIQYYINHAAAKQGFDLDAVLSVVHEANMRKKDPATGKFLRREEDNKIMKPEGWIGPDISAALMKRSVSVGRDKSPVAGSRLVLEPATSGFKKSMLEVVFSLMMSSVALVFLFLIAHGMRIYLEE